MFTLWEYSHNNTYCHSLSQDRAFMIISVYITSVKALLISIISTVDATIKAYLNIHFKMPSKHKFFDGLKKYQNYVWQFDYYHIFVIVWEYFHDSVIVSDSNVYTMIFYCHENSYGERLSLCKRDFSFKVSPSESRKINVNVIASDSGGMSLSVSLTEYEFDNEFECWVQVNVWVEYDYEWVRIWMWM